MNRSAEQTNRLRIPVYAIDLFVPFSDSFPMNPEKKDTHSLIILYLVFFFSYLPCYDVIEQYDLFISKVNC